MTNQPTWESCPEGELTQLAESIRRQERRQLIRKIMAGSAALIVLGVGVYAVTSNSSDLRPLTCAEVRPLLPAYIHGGLTRDAQTQVAEHLKKCPMCRQRHESLRKSGAA